MIEHSSSLMGTSRFKAWLCNNMNIRESESLYLVRTGLYSFWSVADLLLCVAWASWLDEQLRDSRYDRSSGCTIWVVWKPRSLRKRPKAERILGKAGSKLEPSEDIEAKQTKRSAMNWNESNNYDQWPTIVADVDAVVAVAVDVDVTCGSMLMEL